MCPHVWDYLETNRRQCVTCGQMEQPASGCGEVDWEPVETHQEELS